MGQCAQTRCEKILYPSEITETLRLGQGRSLISISAGRTHSGVVTDQGECYTWGGNEMGQLGLPSIENGTHIPEKVAELEVLVTKIACGYNQTLFLTEDGSVLACGYNELGQLGVEEESEIVDIPIPVKGIEEPIVELHASNFLCVISQNRSMYIWGDTPNGMFIKPEKINGLAEIISQAAIGEDLICIMDINNFLYSWGRNESGQLGLGDTEPQKDACSIEALNDREVTNIFAGKNFMIALGKGKATKADNPLLASVQSGAELDGQAGYGEEGSENHSHDQGGDEGDEEIYEDEGTNEYKIVGTETFGGTHIETGRSYEVNIQDPNANDRSEPLEGGGSKQQDDGESFKDNDNSIPGQYQLPKSILDLYKNQKQKEAIYFIKEVETMQAENNVLKQLVCAYEKTRQDLVGILDAIVRNDPDLIEHLDPRDIQKVIQKENFIEKHLFNIKFNVNQEINNNDMEDVLENHEISQQPSVYKLSNPLNSNYVEKPKEPEEPYKPQPGSHRSQHRFMSQEESRPKSRYQVEREEREKSREDRTHACRSRTYKSAISEVYTEAVARPVDRATRTEAVYATRKGSFANGMKNFKEQETSAKSSYLNDPTIEYHPPARVPYKSQLRESRQEPVRQDRFETVGNWRKKLAKRPEDFEEGPSREQNRTQYYSWREEVAEQKQREIPEYVRNDNLKKTNVDPDLYYLYNRLEKNKTKIEDRLQDLSTRAGRHRYR